LPTNIHIYAYIQSREGLPECQSVPQTGEGCHLCLQRYERCADHATLSPDQSPTTAQQHNAVQLAVINQDNQRLAGKWLLKRCTDKSLQQINTTDKDTK